MQSRNDKGQPGAGTADTNRKQASENKKVHLPCPLCYAPIELSDKQGPQQTSCPSCGLACVLDPSRIAAEEEAKAKAEAEANEPVSGLGHWLAGEPIEPRRIGDGERLKRWCRQHPVRLGLAVTLLGILVGVTITASLAYFGATNTLVRQQKTNRQGQVARSELEHQLRDASKRLEEVDQLAQQIKNETRQEYQQKISQAEQSLLQSDQQRQQATRIARTAFSQHLAQRAKQLARSQPQRSLLLAAESLEVALLSGDRPAATAHQMLRDRIQGFDGSYLRGHSGRITSLQTSSDGQWLASGSFDGTARLWNLTDDKPEASSIALKGHNSCVTTVTFSPDSRWLATASIDSTARLWKLSSVEFDHKPIVLRGHQGRINYVAFGGKGRWLVTASSGLTLRENTVRLWDLSAANPEQASLKLPEQLGVIRDVVVSPNGETLATANGDGDIYLWDLTHLDPTAKPTILPGRGEAIATIAFSADGHWLASGSSGLRVRDDTIKVWDLHNNRLSKPRIVGRHEGGILEVLLSPNGRWLVATGQDGTSLVWNLEKIDANNQPVVLQGHIGAIQTAVIDSASQWLMTGGIDGTTRLWSLGRDGPEDSSVLLQTKQGSLAALAIHPEGHLLATAGEDQTIRLWNLRLRKLVDLAISQALGKSQVSKDLRDQPKSLR